VREIARERRLTRPWGGANIAVVSNRRGRRLGPRVSKKAPCRMATRPRRRTAEALAGSEETVVSDPPPVSRGRLGPFLEN
jgi:hypothetical protein